MAEKRKREEPLIILDALSGEAVTEVEVKLDRALAIRNHTSWANLKAVLNIGDEEAFEEYAWFMSCKIGFNDIANNALFVPSVKVDNVWQMHFLRNLSEYVEWCWTLTNNVESAVAPGVINYKTVTDNALRQQGLENYRKTIEVLRERQKVQRVVAERSAGSTATAVATGTAVAAETGGSAATSATEGIVGPDDPELGSEEDSESSDTSPIGPICA